VVLHGLCLQTGIAPATRLNVSAAVAPVEMAAAEIPAPEVAVVLMRKFQIFHSHL
jgi:hypothetical protein